MKSGKKLRHKLGETLLPPLVYWVYRLLSMTWRVTLEESPALKQWLAEGQPVIMAHWHGDELAIIHLVKRYNIATMSSTSKDGELMNKVLIRLGAATSRGSSSRGGAAAMRGLIRLCRNQRHNVSFAVDGPKGPIYKVKAGVFEFSRLMQAPIIAVGVGVSRPWIFKRAWNRAVLPKPFSRVDIRFIEHIPAIDRSQDIHDPALVAKLESMLHHARREVDPGRTSDQS